MLPLHIEAEPLLEALSWFRGMIPKPFAAVAVAIEDPFDVPGTDAETVERSRGVDGTVGLAAADLRQPVDFVNLRHAVSDSCS